MGLNTSTTTPLMILFIFFSQCYRTRVSADRFSRVTIFHRFYPKIDANAHFNSVFSNIGRFNRKTVSTVRFSIIKIRISIIFMHLRSKPTLKNISETRRVNRAPQQSKTISKCPLCHFFSFFSKIHWIYWKTKSTSRFSIVKISVPTSFYVFTIKNALGNTSEISEFWFENSLASWTRNQTWVYSLPFRLTVYLFKAGQSPVDLIRFCFVEKYTPFCILANSKDERIYRDANFYGLSVATTENCKNFQFSTDYGDVELFYGIFFLKKSIAIRNVAKKALNKGIWFPVAKNFRDCVLGLLL